MPPFESSLVAIFRTDKDGNILEANEAFLSLLQVKNLRKFNVRDTYVNPQDRDDFLKRLRTGKVENFEVQLITPKGNTLWASINARLQNDVIEGLIIDITARKHDEQKLKYISEFEALITRLSTHFLELPTEQLDQGLSLALEAIMNFAEVDATFILQFPNQQEQELSYYWSKRSERQTKKMQKMLRVNTFPTLRKVLEKDRILKMENIKDLSKTAPKEFNLLKKEGVKSFICIPMMRGNDLIGALGMVMFSSVREWPDDLDSLLKIASEMFTNALMRKNIDEQVTRLYDSQSKLFSQIAHSLKTPFTVAVSNLELLRNAKSSTEKENYIDTIKSNLRESTAIINQLLKIARMDLFPVGARPGAIQMSKLLDTIYSKTAILFRSYFPDITEAQLAQHLTRGPFEEFEILGDERSLTEAILILIDNAFRHSPRSGELPSVKVSGKRLNNGYQISIKDEGRGIPKGELSQIFELYYQGSDSGEGSGIGLAFCKKVIDSLGGNVEITSQIGRGTEATITFPR